MHMMGFHIFEYIRIIKDMHQERTYKTEPKHARQKLTGAHLPPCPKAWENSQVFSALWNIFRVRVILLFQRAVVATEKAVSPAQTQGTESTSRLQDPYLPHN